MSWRLTTRALLQLCGCRFQKSGVDGTRSGQCATTAALSTRRGGWPLLTDRVARLMSGGSGTVDRSRVPQLNEAELKEKFVRGSGPGGQSVNTTSNCVSLQHIPTGLTVKCHDSRSLETNRRFARQLMVSKLDRHLNGDNCVEAQLARIERIRSERSRSQRHQRRKRKLDWKTREGIT